MIELSETTVEKRCEKCGQEIKKGEGYAETDVGSGKWVHWPSCPSKGSSSPKNPIDVEVTMKPSRKFLVDGLQVKDYYDIRDLRLLLWGLEKELGEKYGVSEASELGQRVRGLIKEKIAEIERKLETGKPESLKKSLTKEEIEDEIDVLIDNLADAMRKGGDIPAYLRDALRKSFMFFKENPGKTHPPVSTGNPGKFTVRFNEGTTKQEDVTLEAPTTAAATILAARQFHEKHGLYPTTAKLITSK